MNKAQLTVTTSSLLMPVNAIVISLHHPHVIQRILLLAGASQGVLYYTFLTLTYCDQSTLITIVIIMAGSKIFPPYVLKLHVQSFILQRFFSTVILSLKLHSVSLY